MGSDVCQEQQCLHFPGQLGFPPLTRAVKALHRPRPSHPPRGCSQTSKFYGNLFHNWDFFQNHLAQGLIFFWAAFTSRYPSDLIQTYSEVSLIHMIANNLVKVNISQMFACMAWRGPTLALAKSSVKPPWLSERIRSVPRASESAAMFSKWNVGVPNHLISTIS